MKLEIVKNKKGITEVIHSGQVRVAALETRSIQETFKEVEATGPTWGS